MGWLTAPHKEGLAASKAPDRLMPMDDQLKQAQTDLAVLKGENDRLQAENALLHQQVVSQAIKSNLVEDSGVLWKRGTDGQVSPIAYCPDCLSSMHVHPPASLLGAVVCAKCNFRAPFKPGDLPQIAKRLSGNGH